MLCSSKTNHRPDQALRRKLVCLSYSLLALAAAVILFMVYPEYFTVLILVMLFLISLCLILTIQTIYSGEEAMSYGGFANEILRNEFIVQRIDNAEGKAVIENEPSRDLFKGRTVLEFLEQHLAKDSGNQTAFYRLKNGCENFISEKVSLSLVLHQEENRIFNEEEWFEISVRPISLKKADIFDGPFSIKAIRKDTYLFWNIQDITADRNMQEVYRFERRSLHDFLDYLPVGLYITDKDNIFEYCNHAFSNLIGFNREELPGRSLSEFLSANTAIPPRNFLWHGSLHFITREKKVLECLAYHESFRENNELKTRGVIIKDIPGEADLHKALDTAADKIGWLFDHAPVGIIFCDSDGRIHESNHLAETFIGPRKETEDTIFEHIKAEDRDRARTEFAAVCRCEKNASSLEVHLTEGSSAGIALLHLCPMRKYYAVSADAADGAVVYLVDATQQKKLEQQFIQAQKNQALGQLAGGVAHDFNNLLTALIGYCDLLLQRHGVGDPSFGDLMQIKHNANRAAGLVKQILAYARQQPIQPKLLDITENFAELSNLLKRTLGEQITLKFYHGSDLGMIHIDPTQFTQIILNLAINAKDAMNGSGTLSITSRVENILEDFAFGADMIKAGEYIAVDVADTGCGIPPENLGHIFEPFFSTKKNVAGSGTGLGLSQVYGIIRQNNGFIRVDSQVGRGTTFSIYLPRQEAGADTASSDENGQDIFTNKDGTPVLTVQEKISGPLSVDEKMIMGMNLSTFTREYETPHKEIENTRILFVDDEDSLRTFALRALKKKGYDVVGCNSAENALDYIKEDKNFDLMITDMVMPGLNGAELSEQVKQQIPGIKIILASGYSEEIVKQEVENFDEFEFLTKPFSLSDLTAKVFDVLNK